VREDHLDHVTILDAVDDPKCPAAGHTALDVAAVDASQALCPADRTAPLGARSDAAVGVLFVLAPLVFGFQGLDLAYYLVLGLTVLAVVALHKGDERGALQPA